MQNSAMLLTAIESGDWSDATVKAALDTLQEDFGHDLRKCVVIVARYLEDSASAAILRAAKNYALKDGKVTPLVQRLCNLEVGLNVNARPRVVVVPGNQPPALILPKVVAGRVIIDSNIIHVGAGWILDKIETPLPPAA